MSIMIFTFFVLLLLSVIAVFANIIQKAQIRQLNRVFREYNQEKNHTVVTQWIEAKNTKNRLLMVLDYLRIIDNEKLSTEILDALDVSRFSDRHVRIFSIRAYLSQKRQDQALKLVRGLHEQYPKDETILELAIDVFISFGLIEEAKPLLEPRLDRKFKGTQFAKHYARIQALEGNLEQAITIMRNVVSRDGTLASNTIAQPQKGLIEKQYQENQALLDQFLEQQEQAAVDAK